MKSSNIFGIACLVIAVSLTIYEPFLQKIGASQPVMSEPTPYAATGGDIIPQSDPDWQLLQPSHKPLPKRRHPLHAKAGMAVKHHKTAVAKANPTHVPKAPLPGPTFLPGTPEPEPTVEIATAPPSNVQVLENYHPPSAEHKPKPPPRPEPTIYAPPTPSARDLARQRQLERAALIDAALRSARATVTGTVPSVHILSADADDHGTSISVVIVEQRSTGIIVESFVFTPGSSALGLAQRRVISQTNSDPYVSH